MLSTDSRQARRGLRDFSPIAASYDHTCFLSLSLSLSRLSCSLFLRYIPPYCSSDSRLAPFVYVLSLLFYCHVALLNCFIGVSAR